MTEQELRRELEADAEELSAIDGVPVPETPRLNITASTISGSVLTVGGGGGLKTYVGGPTLGWAAPTYRIPAGTKFTLDPSTGELTSVADIIVEASR